MSTYAKVECLECGGVSHVEENDIPEDIREGEAFPHRCPLCNNGKYGKLADEQ